MAAASTLGEWLYDPPQADDRARPCQTELDVTLCFAPLLRWVLTWWQSGRLALAIDPTLKGDQTTAIVISVLYRSCAIPVAWHIRHADQRGSWMDPTVELLRELAPGCRFVTKACRNVVSSPIPHSCRRHCFSAWRVFFRFPLREYNWATTLRPANCAPTYRATVWDGFRRPTDWSRAMPTRQLWPV